ncbi:MAG: terpene cyclase/mutase family protein [Planctomycetes bacterium]|nr:terpene cyclase/mutase family protein [Planctomycetota bacterium]
MKALRAALLLGVALAACARGEATDRAVGWLRAQQRPDGGFGSAHYAVLRSGQAMTPFVLHALLTNGVPRDDDTIARGLAFVRRSIGADGAIGYADPDLLEYPVYATSLAILVLARCGDPADRPRIDAMADWLVRQQCGEARGFAPNDAAFGAFGFGARGLPPGAPGHVDLTHTRFALQALAAADRLDDVVRNRASALLGNLQRDDGGFAFSPIVDAANKAGRDANGRFRAYATATADGVLALRALGVPASDARLTAALGWLARNARADRIGGIDKNPSEPWHDALRYYHAMVLAEAWPPLRSGVATMLRARQRGDGSFRSDLVSAMKEDDPLLATALALHALGTR